MPTPLRILPVALPCIVVHLDIRELGAVRGERRGVVAHDDVGVRDGGVGRGFVGVVPVAARDRVTLEEVHVKSGLAQLAEGDETTGRRRR